MSRYFSGPDGVVHSFPDDVSMDEVHKALTPEPQLSTMPSFSQRMRNRVTSLLPMAGGVAGGMGGAALAAPTLNPALIYGAGVVGAGVGGAGGRALEDAVIGNPMSAGDIAMQGGEQALLEGVGQGVARGAMWAAKPLLGRAFGNLSAVAAKYSRPGQTLTPEEILDLLLRKRFAPTSGSEQTAGQSIRNLAVERNNSIAMARGTVTAKTIARQAVRDSEARLGRPLTPTERASLVSTVQEHTDRILTEMTHGAVPHGTPGTPAQPAGSLLDQFGQPAIPAQPAIPGAPSRYTMRNLEQVKEVAAKQARGTYKADVAGTSVAADPDLAKQIAAGARARLAKIAGVADANAQIRVAKIARDAIKSARLKSQEWVAPPLPATFGVKLPRDKMGQVAVWLSSKGFQNFAKRSPRTAAVLVQQALYDDSGDTGP